MFDYQAVAALINETTGFNGWTWVAEIGNVTIWLSSCHDLHQIITSSHYSVVSSQYSVLVYVQISSAMSSVIRRLEDMFYQLIMLRSKDHSRVFVVVYVLRRPTSPVMAFFNVIFRSLRYRNRQPLITAENALNVPPNECIWCLSALQSIGALENDVRVANWWLRR